MYNIMIYPYDETLKNTLLQIDGSTFKIKEIISPKGWGYSGNSICINGCEIKIKADFSKIEPEFDSVCFVNSRFELDFHNNLLPILQECQEKRWDVFWYRSYSEIEFNIVKWYIPSEKLHICDSGNQNYEQREGIYDIKIPIIFIVDMFASLNTQDIQFYICNELKKRGYRAELISSKREMSLINSVKVIPDFLFDELSSNKEKILRFNHYIKNIEFTEQPDLIVMGIPGNLIEVSKSLTGDFGDSAYLISRSIHPDYVVCNMPYFADLENKCELLGTYIEMRIEAKVDAYNIVAQYIDILASEEKKQYDYLSLSVQFIEERIRKSKKIYCLQEHLEVCRIVDDIISKLESYAEIEVK